LKKICEICGNNPAAYVCGECGRNVCHQCFEPDRWICIECDRERKRKPVEYESEAQLISFPLFMKVFLAGFILIFIGMLILMIAGLMGGISQSFGLVVFVGPIPIILGSGKYSLLAILLALILTVLGIIMFIFLRKQHF